MTVVPARRDLARQVAAVFLIALVVRALFAWIVPPAPLLADAVDYDRLARGLVSGRGYLSPEGLPTSERPPLYSYLLAGLYRVTDDAPAAMRGVQAVVDAATCALIYLLAARAFGAGAARAAAGFALVSLSLLFATRHLLTETLAAFFMIATVLALDGALARWRGVLFLLTGALVGLSTLTKGTTLALPAALLLPIWAAAPGDWRRVARAAVLLAAGFIVILLPWTVRNYRVHGEVVPVATQMGWVIYSSYLPPEGKIFGVYTTDDTVVRARALPEAERSRVLLGAAVEHVREHPGELPRLLLLKFLYFVSPFDWEFLGGSVNFIYVLTLPFAACGLWALRRQRVRLLLLAVPPAFLLLLSLGIYGSPRIRIPVEPVLMVLAGGGLALLWDRAGRHRWVLAAAIIVAILLGFAAFVFGPQVKALSAGLLRSLGLW